MNERLLQFIWQFRYFNKSGLSTYTGEGLQVIFPGHHNTNQGPDFIEGRIRIGQTTWVGNIELHLKTSDWGKHQHQHDSHYNNVILHVVWEHDAEENDIPVVELKTRVPKLLLQRYEELMNSSSFIPCNNSIQKILPLTWEKWKYRLVAERLLRKSKIVEGYLQQNNCHWEETCWWLLARNFGMKVNGDAFEAVARSIPLTLLSKHKNQLYQLEALLLGQAGLLHKEFKEEYPVLLQREYHFYQRKYELDRVYIRPLFLRMRPGNFPTVRLAQLAMLVHGSAHLFNKIKEAVSLIDVKRGFSVSAGNYWDDHYLFDEPSIVKKKQLGSSMIDNILINTIIPVLFAYGDYYNESSYKDKGLKWLEEIAAENNNITQGFVQLGIENKAAFDSQALVELKNEYCSKRRCLDCTIGSCLLKRE